MMVDIYRAQKSPKPGVSICIFIPTKTDISSLPQALREKMGTLIFEKTLEIKPGEIRCALNTDEAIKAIEQKGFYISSAEVRITLIQQ